MIYGSVKKLGHDGPILAFSLSELLEISEISEILEISEMSGWTASVKGSVKESDDCCSFGREFGLVKVRGLKGVK